MTSMDGNVGGASRGNWGVWFLGVCLMSAESALLAAGIGQWMMTIQTPLLLMIYVGVTRDFVPAAVMSAAWLPVADVLSGGPPGIIAFGLAGVFFGAQTAAPRLRSPWGSGHWIVSIVAAMLFAGMVTMSLLSMSAFGEIRSSVIGRGVISVVAVALFSWPFGRALEAFEHWWTGARGHGNTSSSRVTLS